MLNLKFRTASCKGTVTPDVEFHRLSLLCLQLKQCWVEEVSIVETASTARATDSKMISNDVFSFVCTCFSLFEFAGLPRHQSHMVCLDQAAVSKVETCHVGTCLPAPLLWRWGGGISLREWEIGQAPVPQGAVPQNWPSSDLFHRWWGCGGHPHLRSFKGGGPETCARCGVSSHTCGADGWCCAASRVASWCLAPIPARQTSAAGDEALPQCHCRGATGMDGPNWSGTATITGGWRWPGWWQAVPLGSSPGSLAAWAGGARGYSARSKIFAAEGRCRTGFRPAAEANSPCADHRPAKHWPRGLQHAEMSWEPPGLYPGIVWSSWLCCLASHFSDAAVASASLADLRVGWCEGWAAWKEDVCCQSSTSCW